MLKVFEELKNISPNRVKKRHKNKLSAIFNNMRQMYSGTATTQWCLKTQLKKTSINFHIENLLLLHKRRLKFMYRREWL